MDLKALLNKLDKLNEHQILMESATIVEEVLSAELELLKESYIALMERVRGRELEALRKVNDEEQRRTQIAALATKNGYPGMFDPVTGKWVDNQGNFAWFGPYKAEVEQMEKDGLVPPEAHTSAFWGVMGKDKDAAFKASSENKSRYDLIDGSDEILDKANQSKKPDAVTESVSKGSIARALTEGFGYSFKYLVESISEQEHNILKANIEKLNSTEYKDDKEAQAVIFKYQEYVKYRDQLIAKIKSALSKITALKPNTLGPTIKTESQVMLKEEIYLVPHSDNTVSSVHFYLDDNGDVVEYIVTEDVEALGRGLMAGATFGWGDNAVAKMISMYKGTPYGEELAKQLKATNDAKDRAPLWYWGGNIGAGLMYGGTGIAKNLAIAGGQYASDRFIREPMNARDLEQNAKNKAVTTPAKPPVDPAVKKVQTSVSTAPTGTMDPNTVSAVRANGAQVSGNNNSSIEQELFTAFGVKDATGLQAKLKQMGVSGYDQVGQAVANALKIAPAPTVATESIIFSSMSDNERMAYLRNRMLQINEGFNPWTGLLKLIGVGAEAALAKILPTLEKAEINLGGQIWKKGQTGYWETTGAGAKKMMPEAEFAGEVQQAVKANPEAFLKANPAKTTAAPANATTNTAANTTANTAFKPKLEQQVIFDNEIYTWKGAQWVSQKTGKTAEKGITGQLNKIAQGSASGAEKAAANVATNAAEAIPKTSAEALTLSQRLAAKYPKTASVLKGIGAVAKFGWNNKWWTAMAAIIGIIGYAYTHPTEPNADDVTNPNNPNKPQVDQKPDPNAIDPQILAQIQQISLDIKNWMDQLIAMYPADKETKDLQAEVAEIMKGLPQKPTVDQKADTNTANPNANLNSVNRWANVGGNVTKPK